MSSLNPIGLSKRLVKGAKQLLYQHLPDSAYMRTAYTEREIRARRLPRLLNLKNPKTWPEKLIHLSLNIERLIPNAHFYADKIAVRDYVADTIGSQFLVPLLGTWERAEDIDWDDLPDAFVIKANHGCGFNIFVEDKAALNVPDTVHRLNAWLDTNYSKTSREKHYAHIPPRLLAEPLLGAGSRTPTEIKAHTFGGRVGVIPIQSGPHRDRRFEYVDRDWERVAIKKPFPPDRPTPPPGDLRRVVELLEALAAPFFYVRVDLLSVGDSVSFSEFTFTPDGGRKSFRPRDWDVRLGNLIHLPPAG